MLIVILASSLLSFNTFSTDNLNNLLNSLEEDLQKLTTQTDDHYQQFDEEFVSLTSALNMADKEANDFSNIVDIYTKNQKTLLTHISQQIKELKTEKQLIDKRLLECENRLEKTEGSNREEITKLENYRKEITGLKEKITEIQNSADRTQKIALVAGAVAIGLCIFNVFASKQASTAFSHGRP